MAEQTMEFRGFTITVTDPDSGYGESPEDVVIFIDTPPGGEFTANLRIRINDGLVYNANPEKPEDVVHTPFDGWHIVNAEVEGV